MKRVIIESPFSANAGLFSIPANVDYARKCCLDAVMQKENPFASHVFYTQFLDDNNPEHRAIGIGLGFDWWAQADLVAFYVDCGMSNGMKDALAKCALENIPYEIRRLRSPEMADSHMQRLDQSNAAVGDVTQDKPPIGAPPRDKDDALDRFAKTLANV